MFVLVLAVKNLITYDKRLCTPHQARAEGKSLSSEPNMI